MDMFKNIRETSMSEKTKNVYIKELDENVLVFTQGELLTQGSYLFDVPKSVLKLIKETIKNTETEFVINIFMNGKTCNSLADFSSTAGVIVRFNFFDTLLYILSGKFAPDYTKGSVRYFDDDFGKYNRMKVYTSDHALNEYLNRLQMIFYEMDLLTFVNLYTKSNDAIHSLSSDTVALVEKLNCYELDNFDKIDKVRMVAIVSEICNQENGEIKSYNALTEHKYKMNEYSIEIKRLLFHISKNYCSLRTNENNNHINV
ncbi:hypothetical protein FACS1894190_02300 [Spirochaetia bacterium]|nr:hypothetical protein FACS1894190_02300 [Spirochaetia bacterium]